MLKRYSYSTGPQSNSTKLNQPCLRHSQMGYGTLYEYQFPKSPRKSNRLFNS